MEIHEQMSAEATLITRIEKDAVWINDEAIHQSFWLSHNHHTTWSPMPPITTEQVSPFIKPNITIILLGFEQADAFRLMHPALIPSLNQQGIGLEVMTLDAACRTYNTLIHEGRSIALGIIRQR